MFGVVGWHHTTLHLILSVMCTVILQMELACCKECSLPQWGGRTSVEFGLGLSLQSMQEENDLCLALCCDALQLYEVLDLLLTSCIHTPLSMNVSFDL